MKRPAFQFYPADWRKDTSLQSCSLEAQGLWINMLCLMHESENYGFLEIFSTNFEKKSEKNYEKILGKLTGITAGKVKKLLYELESFNVFSRDDRGVIFSRRMVKDQRIREIRMDAGSKGGNPNLLKQNDNDLDNQKDNQTGNQKPTPSTSSSTSSTNIREREDDSEPKIKPSDLCINFSKLGMIAANPQHPVLLDLIKNGITEQQLNFGIAEAVAQKKPFLYGLRIAEDAMNNPGKFSVKTKANGSNHHLKIGASKNEGRSAKSEAMFTETRAYDNDITPLYSKEVD